LLGIEHIFSGIDHLFFVMALLFLVGFNKNFAANHRIYTGAQLDNGAGALG
jgi:HupE / UreJ protein